MPARSTTSLCTSPGSNPFTQASPDSTLRSRSVPSNVTDRSDVDAIEAIKNSIKSTEIGRGRVIHVLREGIHGTVWIAAIGSCQRNLSSNELTGSIPSAFLVKSQNGLTVRYYTTYQLSQKSDVYSFGVVLLELITGQPPLLQAMKCTSQGSQERPTMAEVVMQLKEKLELDTPHDRTENVSTSSEYPNMEVSDASQTSAYVATISVACVGPSAREFWDHLTLLLRLRSIPIPSV
ncbi:receptor-like serine threonine-protein kinase [Musa troglodytarum]|uniref:Receptor-like serine threonine-protein kinase n=1 Tax=Musa troglodytarum TaxID=320322 RepID=A0A9E7HAJ0_9LILI|nr:receptor-like serine threonine-protein kinase [Musa troglodytarum]